MKKSLLPEHEPAGARALNRHSRKAEPVWRTMNDLAPGEEAVIRQIHHSGGVGQRLMALGMLPGCRMKFLRLAPLGDPMMIEVAGCAFCLRRREACLVEIQGEEEA